MSTDFTDRRQGRRRGGRRSNLKTPELRVVDTVILGNVRAHESRTADSGLRGDARQSRATGRVSVNWGYASIDHGATADLNSDRFHIGNRAFGDGHLHHLAGVPGFGVHHAGDRQRQSDIPQRTLANIIFTYNALPALRRTGVF